MTDVNPLVIPTPQDWLGTEKQLWAEYIMLAMDALRTRSGGPNDDVDDANATLYSGTSRGMVQIRNLEFTVAHLEELLMTAKREITRFSQQQNQLTELIEQVETDGS